jgi:hypothetical protein
LLLHTILSGSGSNPTLTLQRLNPITLEPVWSVSGLVLGADIRVAEPVEDVVLVLTQTMDKPPYSTQLAAYSLDEGSLKWQWRAAWPISTSFDLHGMVFNRTDGRQRVCGTLSQSLDSK